EERNYIFSHIYYGDEESNYHYIYSFFCFFFQVQDNPKRLCFFLPIEALPSPVTIPIWMIRLKLLWFTPTFTTCLTIAEQFLNTKRTSPEGNFNVADFPSFAIIFATVPAALANCPPFP
ncbi:hypothetical protein Ccrd_013049, partial [Cynara cardunculus var. scolymus]